MHVYIAARYGRREEMLGHKADLEAAGHRVTSRWLEGGHQIPEIQDNGVDLPGTVEQARSFAEEDIEDLLAAGGIVCFTEPPGLSPNRGGRHVEMGIALGLAYTRFGDSATRCAAFSTRQVRLRRLLVVGHRENVFCCLEEVEFYATWPEALAALEPSKHAERHCPTGACQRCLRKTM
jgi:hypothetical protein